ncbi:hypothetical protein C488_10251 [Natrinema pellirubrum DSM 15624]|uniref:DUF2795 domain-containing protein n=1 Tax=Natrinema pellirubrum (strain DSM 15624 / CIP 106293 / JCM 10476 / NCIMB 786 / 157) TaxID=797303 RepID=L0JP44_NATP1|nr:hypothetical protein [Natrinema pellirubrum]AGB33024.1 hypothetical protein Natpe_3234 [Natrinema pellirubrum DSM 15624]ELY75128.1 hypothetical protein C488_10251 [Natrinema pellirubrum DSM 15624]
MPDVKLSRIDSVLENLEYPITTDRAASELADVTLLLADGQRNLGDLVAKSDSDRFESTEDLQSELNNVLPREAVGEPYQSEGEG